MQIVIGVENNRHDFGNIRQRKHFAWSRIDVSL